MSVDKIPNIAAHGASNAQNGGNIKGGHGAGAGDASDPQGFFGALLSSLGVDDAEPTVTINAVSNTSDDQIWGDAGSDESALMAFTPMVQLVPLPVTAASVADVARGGIQNALLAMGGTPVAAGIAVPGAQSALLAVGDTSVADGIAVPATQSALLAVGDTSGVDSDGLVTANALFSGVFPNTKHGFRYPGQTDLSHMPDAAGPGSARTTTARLLKERGRTEIASAVTTVPMQSPNVADASRLDMRVFSDKVELGRAIATVPVDALPLEVGQQTEFRRDKAIFKTNSTTAGADVSATNGLDTKPLNLSLEGMATDVGAGMTQGDQNPGTYWMSSDMKNAEMKLDGFGESPVEVSISVHGNQTHVAFRTDEAHTRLALEDAGATLKDMLSKEGLNLGGVSVGTSGAGGNATQDHRSRQEGRPALIGNLASKFPSGTSGHIVTSRVGQLDVFV